MSSSQDTAINILKRRCETLEDQLAVATAPKPKNVVQAQIYAGRPIRRLVSFFDGAQELVEENDNRLMLEFESAEREGGDNDCEDRTIEQERQFRGYKELIRFVPLVKTTTEGTREDMTSFYKNIGKGSDMARGDDAASLKVVIVGWVHELFGLGPRRLDSKHKLGRGLDHDHCGMLLCPVEFDWSDLTVRAKIRAGDPEYTITASSWPAFVYAEFQTHANDMERGLFRSELLVKAYKHVFTSPTSAAEEENTENEFVPLAKRRKMGGAMTKRPNIASLMNLREVTPRSIAYITVQLRFALSSLNAWSEVDIDFNHREFYNAVVDYFEDTPGPVAQRNNEELLHWWNKKIFRRTNRQSKIASLSANTSVMRLRSQRAAKEFTQAAEEH